MARVYKILITIDDIFYATEKKCVHRNEKKEEEKVFFFGYIVNKMWQIAHICKQEAKENIQ